MASDLSISRSLMHTKSTGVKYLGKAVLFTLTGGAFGLLYAIVMYGFLGPELFLGAGTSIFLSLAYYLIEFVLIKHKEGFTLPLFIKGVFYYTLVISIAVFVLLVMNDIALALEEYGTFDDVPISLSIVPLVVLFSFFASFVFLAGRMWLGRK